MHNQAEKLIFMAYILQSFLVYVYVYNTRELSLECSNITYHASEF
jgi:hypothetical protein